MFRLGGCPAAAPEAGHLERAAGADRGGGPGTQSGGGYHSLAPAFPLSYPGGLYQMTW